MAIAAKVSILDVCMSPGYSCVVLYAAFMYLSSRFFNQLLVSRLWLVIVSFVSLDFVRNVFLSIFLYWYSHCCNSEKPKVVKKLFVSLITAAVPYCRYAIDKDSQNLLQIMFISCWIFSLYVYSIMIYNNVIIQCI